MDKLLGILDKYQTVALWLGGIGTFLASIYFWGRRMLSWIWPGRGEWQISYRVDDEGDIEKAIRGGRSTGWRSDLQQAGMSIRLDLGRYRTIAKLEIDHGPNDYSCPKRWHIWMYPTDVPTGMVFEGHDRMVLELSQPIRTRRVALSIQEARPQVYWQIFDIKLYERRLWGLWTTPINE